MHVECRYAQAALAKLTSSSDPDLKVKCEFPDCQAIIGRPKISLGMHHGEVPGNPRQIEGSAYCDRLITELIRLNPLNKVSPEQKDKKLKELENEALGIGITTTGMWAG